MSQPAPDHKAAESNPPEGRHGAFLPFARPSIDAETVAAVADVLRSGWITSGPQVEAFESGLSGYLGGRTVRAFTSATGALEVALQACNIGAGDEVIVPAMTFAATAAPAMTLHSPKTIQGTLLASACTFSRSAPMRSWLLPPLATSTSGPPSSGSLPLILSKR